MPQYNATFGDSPAALRPPWQAGDAITSDDSGVATVVGATVVFHGVGSCVLTNTTRNPATKNVTVASASQSIALAAAQTVAFSAGATVTLPTTSSASLPVIYQSSDAGVAEAIGGGTSVVIRGDGSATLTADADGDANTDDAPTVTQLLTVTPLAQTITFGAQEPMAVGSTRSLPSVSSEGLTLTYASAAPGIAAVSGNTLTAVAPGSVVITASQNGQPGVTAASPVSQQVVVFTFTNQTDGATGLTDVEVNLEGGAVFTGTPGLSAGDALADNDSLPKHFRLDVPDYAGTGSPGRVQPHTYLHMGAYPTEGSLLDRGDDMLKAIGIEAAVGTGLVTDKWFFDDHRKNAGNQESSTVYNRDDFESQTPLTAPVLTAQLLTRGGWREHTDGNRISTTRGDRVDIIGGNYAMVILGRMWDLESMHAGTSSPDPKCGFGYSYWESSGGHNRDSTNTPGEPARIAWKESSWQVIHETLKGDVESHHYGVSEEYFIGPSLKSRVGSSTAAVASALTAVGVGTGAPVIPDAAVAGPERQTGTLPSWNNSGGRTQVNPTISDTTEASTMTSHTLVKTTVTETTDCDDTITEKTLAGGGNVTIASYTPRSLSDSDMDRGLYADGAESSGDSISTFKERTHSCAILGYEEFDSKKEKESGDWTFEVNLPVILAASFTLAASATLVEGDFTLQANVNIFSFEGFLGVSSTTKIGAFLDINCFKSEDLTVGKKYHLTVPLRAKAESLKSDNQLVYNKGVLSIVDTTATDTST